MSKTGNEVADKCEARFCEWRGLNCYNSSELKYKMEVLE
jgi:hypothetical protein